MIVITGASDGIGAAAARQLVTRGHQVALVGRSKVKTAAVAAELGAPYHVADYADLSQVRRLAGELTHSYPRIDVLANNAGGVMGRREVTVDGCELTFQVNHLAGFLLTTLLLPTLIRSRASVIQTSSIAARLFSRLDLSDLQNERYSAQRAYGNAKLANILFTRELHRRFGSQGLCAAAFHPGVVGTNFASDTPHPMRLIYHTPGIRRLFTVPADQGAAPLVWLIEGKPGLTWESGQYYERSRVARSSPAADDAGLATRLWDASEALAAASA